MALHGRLLPCLAAVWLLVTCQPAATGRTCAVTASRQHSSSSRQAGLPGMLAAPAAAAAGAGSGAAWSPPALPGSSGAAGELTCQLVVTGRTCGLTARGMQCSSSSSSSPAGNTGQARLHSSSSSTGRWCRVWCCLGTSCAAWHQCGCCWGPTKVTRRTCWATASTVWCSDSSSSSRELCYLCTPSVPTAAAN